MSGVWVISGSQALLRLRRVNELVAANEASGVRIEHADASVPGAIEAAIEGNPFLGGGGPALVVVSNPEKGDLDLYRSLAKAKKPEALLLLHYEGEPDGRTKFAKFAAELKAKHQKFSGPGKWTAIEDAADFIIKEAKEQHGKEVDRKLAQALAQRAGTDYGFLVFELRKMALLADAAGSKVIDRDHISTGMSELLQVDIGLLFDAIRTRNRRGLLATLDRLKKRSRQDPLMWVTSMLGAEATKWLQAASLENLPPKVAAAELGVNAYYFEKTILPAARAWGRNRIIRLIKALAEAERGLLDGHIDPWIGLCSRLLEVC